MDTVHSQGPKLVLYLPVTAVAELDQSGSRLSDHLFQIIGHACYRVGGSGQTVHHHQVSIEGFVLRVIGVPQFVVDFAPGLFKNRP